MIAPFYNLIIMTLFLLRLWKSGKVMNIFILLHFFLKITVDIWWIKNVD